MDGSGTSKQALAVLLTNTHSAWRSLAVRKLFFDEDDGFPFSMSEIELPLDNFISKYSIKPVRQFCASCPQIFDGEFLVAFATTKDLFGLLQKTTWVVTSHRLMVFNELTNSFAIVIIAEIGGFVISSNELTINDVHGNVVTLRGSFPSLKPLNKLCSITRRTMGDGQATDETTANALAPVEKNRYDDKYVSQVDDVLGSLAAPLTISITTDCDTIVYQETTTDATLSAVRADILAGKLPCQSNVSAKTVKADGSATVWEGTLLQVASQYPLLSYLYTPISRYAAKGTRYGILSGIIIYIAFLIVAVFRLDPTLGMMILSIPALFGLFIVCHKGNKKGSGWAGCYCVLMSFYLPMSRPVLFEALTGAALAGSLLFSMPGRAIGAAIGAIRRPGLQVAGDAPHESTAYYIGVPLAVGIAIWAAYLVWGIHYLYAFRGHGTR